MIEVLKKNKWIIIGLTLLFVGFIIYNNFIKKEDISVVQEINVVDSSDTESMIILNILDKIDKIDLRPDFFLAKSDKNGYILTFRELVDFPIVENKKPAGKFNPFIYGAGMNFANINGNIDDLENTENNQTENLLNPENTQVDEVLINSEE